MEGRIFATAARENAGKMSREMDCIAQAMT
jgi:hypothetical protein